MSIKPPKPQSAPVPMLKNAALSPVIYFDGVPAVGSLSGVIEIELCARMLMPQRDNGASVDMVSVAHLRCSGPAAVALRDSINKALEILDRETQLVRKGQDWIDQDLKDSNPSKLNS